MNQASPRSKSSSVQKLKFKYKTGESSKRNKIWKNVTTNHI